MIFVFTSSQKSLGEKLEYNNDYKNVDVDIWLLDKEVNMWGIELMMETPHIEWCFQFEKWKDLDKIKYVHVVNLKAYNQGQGWSIVGCGLLVNAILSITR